MSVRFEEHPNRRQVVGEMHLRRFPAIALPAHVIQLVRIVADKERLAEQDALAVLPGRVEGSARHRECRWSPDILMSWERHSEASTATLVLTNIAPDWAAVSNLRVRQALDTAEAMPGIVIRATHLIVVDSEDEAAPALAGAGFAAPQLISCRVANGARLWSDFQIHHDGYGRLVVAANRLSLADLSRGLQRLQELGNYRNLALLGLPVAQEAWGRLDQIERQLGSAGRALSERSLRDDDLLASLTSATERLVALASECDFRLSATAAYAEIVTDRLSELNVQAIEGYPSLVDFTARRFNPAIRTCAAFSRRLDALNSRAAQFTALLRTRIETNIENQNSMLLASLDRSARMQLRLQHLVEGLSAVAISYYLLGLIGYPLKAAEKLLQLSSTKLLGIAAPLLTLAVFLMLRAMKKRLIHDDGMTAPKGA